MQPPPYGVPPPPPGHYAPPGHAYGYDPYARPELHGSQPAGYYAGAGYGQHDYYRQQNAYGHERHVEYGSGFNDGESRPRDHGSNADRGDRFEGQPDSRQRDYSNHQDDWKGRGDHRDDRHERGERDRDRRDRDRRDRDDLHNSAGDHGFDRRAGHGPARDDDRTDSDHRRGHEGHSDPRPPKGAGKGGRGRGGQGSRELARSRSRSRRRSSSGSSSGSPQEKKRMRKAAGFDSVTKPREAGKVPTEAAPQRGLALAPGRKADVHGLKGASQYNGCEGIVIEGPNDKGRWEVQVDYQCETKTCEAWQEMSWRYDLAGGCLVTRIVSDCSRCFRPSVQPGNFFRAAEGKLPFNDAPKHPSIPPCSNITTSTTVVYLNGDADAASLRIVLHLQCAGLAEAAKGPIPATDEALPTAVLRPGQPRPCTQRPVLRPQWPLRCRSAQALLPRGRDGFTFLNHGAFGATLKSSLESKRRWAEHIETQPVRFLDRELFPWMVSVTRSLSQVLSVPAEDLQPVPSATLGTNAVLRSWQRQRKPDDSKRAVILSVAYGSTKKLLKRMSEESGFQVVEATVDFPLAGDAEEMALHC
eukprot:s5183_g3.t3